MASFLLVRIRVRVMLGRCNILGPTKRLETQDDDIGWNEGGEGREGREGKNKGTNLLVGQRERIVLLLWMRV